MPDRASHLAQTRPAPCQLLDAVVLRRLRDLDVPIRQIREVLQARDPAVTGRVLAAHSKVMQQRLDDTLRIIKGVQRGWTSRRRTPRFTFVTSRLASVTASA